MRRIINSTYVSLDGVIENPQDWPSLDGGDDTGTTIQTDLLLDCDAVLLGRHTYQSFASVWQGRSGDPYTDQMNGIAKYVVSTTLREPSWNNTTVITDPVAEITQLKQRPGANIVQYGYGRLAHTLLAHGLLDELRLWIHPFLVGNSGPEGLLFRQDTRAGLTLSDATTLASGIVILTYQVTHADPMSRS